MKPILAYPNYSDYVSSTPSYDLNRWMQAFKTIHIKTKLGASRQDAIKQTINDWSDMEKIDFKHWMDYYTSGDINKYKMAQKMYYVNDDINYFLPNPANKIVPSPIKSINDQIAAIPQEIQTVVQQKPAELPQEEKRKMIEEQRKKILGRLNSVEKLLSSHQGHMFAGPEFERLLTAIYELKKQIQTVNKITLSAETCTDLMIRQANKLIREGHKEAAGFMLKLAQSSPPEFMSGMPDVSEGQGPTTPGDFSVNLGEIPSGGSVPQGKGSLGNNNPSLDSLTKENPNNKNDGIDSQIKDDLKGGVDGFLANMEGSGITLFDNNTAEDDTDEIEIGDQDDVILDQEIVSDDDIVVEAQLAEQISGPKTNQNEAVPNGAPEIPVEKKKTDVDVLVNNVMNDATIDDAIAELEEVNAFFRQRSLSRRLALVDMILSKLNIIGFFMSLNEVQEKVMSSSQYCSTRLEEIISRLRSATIQHDVSIKNDAIANPKSDNLRKNLEEQERKERERKEMRQQMSDQRAEEKLTQPAKPELEVENLPQDLTQATPKVEQPKQAPKLNPIV